MIVVSDTTAISCMFKIGKLHLLQQFSNEVYLPDAVWQEFTRLQQKGYDLTPLKAATWIKVETASNLALVAQLRNELDEGESEAIALALEKNAEFLLIDEKNGRAKARQMDIPTIGMVGIFLTLKQNQLLPAVKPVLYELRDTAGFYMSDAFYTKILMSAGE